MTATLLTAALLPALACAPPVPGKVIIVTLRPAVVVTRPRVLLGEVVSLEGGSARERERLGALDLLDLPVSGGEATVSREQVEFRLLLAGVERSRFRLVGSATGAVRLLTLSEREAQVLAAAREQLRLHLPGPAEKYQVRLDRPVRLPELPGEGVTLQAETGGRPNLPGLVRVDVAAYVHGVRAAAIPVFFDVQFAQSGAVVLQRIETGAALAPGNVRLVGPPGQPAGRQRSLFGRRARRVLLPGEVVGPEDVEDPPPTPVLVRARDLVQLVVKIGGLKVTARGEVQSPEGREGESVRVRNVDSNTIIMGRVVSRSVVEVDY